MIKTHERVLKECGIRKRPVSLERILRHYGIEHVKFPAEATICGAIVRERGKVFIAVNSNQHLHRQRFTVAHELGHYFCHYADDADVEHVDRDFRVDWHMSAMAGDVPWEEIEANRFAAGLLVPERLLRSDLDNSRNMHADLVQHLASLYGVSKSAMHYRLIAVGLLPAAIDPSAEAVTS